MHISFMGAAASLGCICISWISARRWQTRQYSDVSDTGWGMARFWLSGNELAAGGARSSLSGAAFVYGVPAIKINQKFLWLQYETERSQAQTETHTHTPTRDGKSWICVSRCLISCSVSEFVFWGGRSLAKSKAVPARFQWQNNGRNWRVINTQKALNTSGKKLRRNPKWSEANLFGKSVFMCATYSRGGSKSSKSSRSPQFQPWDTRTRRTKCVSEAEMA